MFAVPSDPRPLGAVKQQSAWCLRLLVPSACCGYACSGREHASKSYLEASLRLSSVLCTAISVLVPWNVKLVWFAPYPAPRVRGRRAAASVTPLSDRHTSSSCRPISSAAARVLSVQARSEQPNPV